MHPETLKPEIDAIREDHEKLRRVIRSGVLSPDQSAAAYRLIHAEEIAVQIGETATRSALGDKAAELRLAALELGSEVFSTKLKLAQAERKARAARDRVQAVLEGLSQGEVEADVGRVVRGEAEEVAE